MRKLTPSAYFLVPTSLILYIIIGYGLHRHQTPPLFACYFFLFLIYLAIIRGNPTTEKQFRVWMIIAIGFRATLMFSEPALSDDFYRFIWDGRLLAAGYHPFSEVPSYYMTHQPFIPGIDFELYEKLNSKETFTIYPPVCQFIFWLSATLSTGSIYSSMLTMKLIIFAFEIGTLWIFVKVLRQFNQPQTKVMLYALNPLVILELMGNLHFEGIMLFFLLLGVFLLKREKAAMSAFSYALSVCTKLIPLIFLPLLVRDLGWKKAMAYWAFTAVFTVLLFLPLLTHDIISGLYTSMGYYFQRFEFNASIYYLVRGLGYLLFGFNIIQVAGPLLGLISALLILTISFRKLPAGLPARVDVGIFAGMLWCLLSYLLLTPILHPWYIITLFAISIFTPYRFPLVWTSLIFLTYAGYTETTYNENLILVAVEYIFVIAYFLCETVWPKRQNPF